MDMTEQEIINDEIMAAISAAVAMAATEMGCRLVVKNIRRTPHTVPVWNSAGRVERLRNDMNS